MSDYIDFIAAFVLTLLAIFMAALMIIGIVALVMAL